jgi:hypothetical protein
VVFDDMIVTAPLGWVQEELELGFRRGRPAAKRALPHIRYSYFTRESTVGTFVHTT